VKDASGSWPIEGLLNGNQVELGAYYSCLEAEIHITDNQTGALNSEHGQHCIVKSSVAFNKGLETQTEADALFSPFGPLMGTFGPVVQVNINYFTACKIWYIVHNMHFILYNLISKLQI